MSAFSKCSQTVIIRNKVTNIRCNTHAYQVYPISTYLRIHNSDHKCGEKMALYLCAIVVPSIEMSISESLIFDLESKGQFRLRVQHTF
jgi:hypothetical protein